MTTLSENPLFQELLNKGYKPGYNPETGLSEVLFLFNITGKDHKVELTKPATLNVLSGGLNNNPTEQISHITDLGDKYTTTLAKNPQLQKTDRIAFGLGSSPEPTPYGYEMDLNLSTESPSLQAVVLGVNEESPYAEPNQYAFALCGLFLGDGIVPVGGYNSETKMLYNLKPDQSQSIQLTGITSYKPPLISQEHVGLRVFGNTSFQPNSDGYAINLTPRTNPLTTSMFTTITQFQDYRWSSSGFDGWTFGFAFRIGDNPQVYSEMVNVSYTSMFVDKNVRVFDLLMQKVIDKYSGDTDVLNLFNHSGGQGFAFNVLESTPTDNPSDGGPTFLFAGLEPDYDTDSMTITEVSIVPAFIFDTSNPVINIGRDYRLGEEVMVVGNINHIEYPIFSQNKIVAGVA